jgi:hypothetical protein
MQYEHGVIVGLRFLMMGILMGIHGKNSMADGTLECPFSAQFCTSIQPKVLLTSKGYHHQDSYKENGCRTGGGLYGRQKYELIKDIGKKIYFS